MRGDDRRTFQRASAQQVRATIAQHLLGTLAPDIRVGDIRLYPHQVSAVRRAQAAITEFGGALLCDDVGLGKTYVALAIAAAAGRTLIVAPATLGPMWHAACARAHVNADLISMETLSYRDGGSAPPYDFIIVDEAHQARTPSTRRYSALAQYCAPARILLLSATPIHNRRADLTTLLALFLGPRAESLTDPELARLLIRRTQARVSTPSHIPSIRPTRWLQPPNDERLLETILTLSPPLPPRGAGEAHTLTLHTLIRQWASSDGALIHAIRRRRGRAAALQAALAVGRYPTARELHAWVADDDAIQLAFPELITAPGSSTADSTTIAELAKTVNQHAEELQTLLHLTATSSSNDQYRADTLLRLRRRHPGEKLIAFSQYADTIDTLFRLLRPAGKVAALTARGGLVAGGRISRHEAIARFAPRANGTTAPPPSEDITLLLTTDILSEGVNLQDASVIIHLDLPWTAAKFDQRIGRAARLGSLHTRVTVYAFRPSQKADALLRMTEIVRAKAIVAHDTIGGQSSSGSRDSSDPISAPSQQSSVPERTEAIYAALSCWLQPDCPPVTAPTTTDGITHPFPPIVAAVRNATPGFLALCLVDGTPTLVTTDSHGEITTALSSIQHSINSAQHRPCPIDAHRVTAALHALHQWHNHIHAAADAGIPDISSSNTQAARTQKIFLRRITALSASAPLMHRAHVASLAQIARRHVTRGLPATLAHPPRHPLHPGTTWLETVAQFARGRPTPILPPPHPPSRALTVIALILFLPHPSNNPP